MATPQIIKQYVPLTCHGHSRPVMHLSFSSGKDDDLYYMISACKDGNPMLRDGLTGDWIGTFLGHKGAVWQARLSHDSTFAATASADFTARVWDTFTGECLYILQHNHIVRCVAWPPNQSSILATGGNEKKLQIWDLGKGADSPLNGIVDGPRSLEASFELGAGVHQGTIKYIVWTHDPNILITAADDKVIRWWDLRTRSVIQEQTVDGEIGTCEFVNVKSQRGALGNGEPLLTICAGKTIYIFQGKDGRELIKTIKMPYDVASVALHPSQRKFVTGGAKDTWAKVYDYDTERELDVHKGHHGPIWSISFSPDGNLYATGSEDGTIKMWKNCTGNYGLWKAGNE